MSENKRLKIYIAGPYTAEDPKNIELQVRDAIRMGIKVMLKGHYPLIPHLTHFVAIDEACPWGPVDRRWVSFDTPWLDACDAILVTRVVNNEGKASQGVLTELIRFAKSGKQVFRSIDEIPNVGEHKPID